MVAGVFDGVNNEQFQLICIARTINFKKNSIVFRCLNNGVHDVARLLWSRVGEGSVS